MDMIGHAPPRNTPALSPSTSPHPHIAALSNRLLQKQQHASGSPACGVRVRQHLAEMLVCLVYPKRDGRENPEGAVMDRSTALEHIQLMRETKTVSREAVVAWYSFYAHKLPDRHPERSEVDLVRTIALWMELTDRGGSPGFPYDYRTDMQFPDIERAEDSPPSKIWPIGVLLYVAAAICLFLNWKISVYLLLVGLLIQYAGYRRQGGSSNPVLMTPDSSEYESVGQRVLEWVSQAKKNGEDRQ